ncbi:MAG TPA: hypothetical protein VHX37_06100 [Acidobacteriaceae bacterium]|nr:hypothetical protein [Acidobacteriaceae bacterium]
MSAVIPSISDSYAWNRVWSPSGISERLILHSEHAASPQTRPTGDAWNLTIRASSSTLPDRKAGTAIDRHRCIRDGEGSRNPRPAGLEVLGALHHNLFLGLLGRATKPSSLPTSVG